MIAHRGLPIFAGLTFTVDINFLFNQYEKNSLNFYWSMFVPIFVLGEILLTDD